MRRLRNLARVAFFESLRFVQLLVSFAVSAVYCAGSDEVSVKIVRVFAFAFEAFAFIFVAFAIVFAVSGEIVLTFAFVVLALLGEHATHNLETENI